MPASPERRGWIDPDHVAAYALATNDPNPRHLAGQVVPPVFTVALLLPTFISSEPDRSVVVRGAKGGVHAQQDIRFLGDLRPGDDVHWTTEEHSARQTKAGVLTTRRIVVTDPDGRPLVEHLWSSMHIGGTIDAPIGPDLPDHTFPERARDRPLARWTTEITRDQGFRFAGVSGDHNPHSMDDRSARREGFPRKILQGLATISICSGAVVALVADGETTRLRRLAARVNAPTVVGQELVVEMFDAGTTDDGLRVVAFEASAGGRTVIRNGRAELAT